MSDDEVEEVGLRMGNKTYAQLHLILSEFPHLHRFLDDAFIRNQCRRGLTNLLLKRLNDEESSSNTKQHLPTLERRLAELARPSSDYDGAGYIRLEPLLRKASDWDQYQEALAQIDITLWFKQKGLLREIEPNLPHRNGHADILLSFSQHDIYCECTSFQSIAKSMGTKGKYADDKRLKKLSRLLLEKTKRQLPPTHPGILALDTTKSAVFAFDVRTVAGRLFDQRPQLALIALWSWEGEPSWDKTPNAFFINPNSNFRGVGDALLDSWGLTDEVLLSRSEAEAKNPTAQQDSSAFRLRVTPKKGVKN